MVSGSCSQVTINSPHFQLNAKLSPQSVLSILVILPQQLLQFPPMAVFDLPNLLPPGPSAAFFLFCFCFLIPQSKHPSSFHLTELLAQGSPRVCFLVKPCTLLEGKVFSHRVRLSCHYGLQGSSKSVVLKTVSQLRTGFFRPVFHMPSYWCLIPHNGHVVWKQMAQVVI